MNIILVGGHGVGKTTTARALGAMLDLPVHDEIGRTLAEDPSERPPGTLADDRQPSFDEAVFRAELQRDALWSRRGSRIVETWHPGNLAYASIRSPEVVTRLLPAVTAATRAAGPVVVVPLTATEEILRRRQSEPGDFWFFREVDRRAIQWATRLGLRVVPPVSTSEAAPEAVAARVRDLTMSQLRSDRT